MYIEFQNLQTLQIPNAETAANAAIVDTTDLVSTANAQRLCGRRLNYEGIADASVTMCSKS